MAVLKCQLRDSSLFVSTLPVDSSTPGMADHHSIFVRMLILVLFLLEIMSNSLFHGWWWNYLSWNVLIRPHGILQMLK